MRINKIYINIGGKEELFTSKPQKPIPVGLSLVPTGRIQVESGGKSGTHFYI